MFLSRIARSAAASPSYSSALRRFSVASNEPLVKVERKGSHALITLNSPERLNALTVAMGDEFVERVDALADDCDDVSAVIVTGAGKVNSRPPLFFTDSTNRSFLISFCLYCLSITQRFCARFAFEG